MTESCNNSNSFTDSYSDVINVMLPAEMLSGKYFSASEYLQKAIPSFITLQVVPLFSL